MTRIDTFVVGALVVLLAIVAGLIGIPAIQIAATPPGPVAQDPADAPLAGARPYVEGVMGAVVSVSPLTARTQVDRDLVALVFAGLVRDGPGGMVVPDLAASWSVDATGRTWTVVLRDGAIWHDGEPVTSADVVFTIRTLQDPAYTGPGATSWREVTVAAPSPSIVTFTLATPLGGFLQALTQPIAPVHLLGDVPIEALPDHPFGRQPVGSGPFSLIELDDVSAVLVPATGITSEDPVTEPSAGSSDSLATPAPTRRPKRPVPYLSGIELRMYNDPQVLAADFRAGDLDAVSGVAPELAAELGAAKGSRLLRYPGSTLTTVLLNLRATHPEFADPKVRTALLAAIDRGAIIKGAYAASAVTASGPIPPSSPWFDPAADPPVTFDRKAARAVLKAAGWVKKDDGWYLPKARTPLTIELLSPTEDVNAGLFASARLIAADWVAIGLSVTHVPLPPGEFVTARLQTGTFQVAVVDVGVGLDPDLYPLLASTQTLTGGSNVAGLQSPELDTLLAKARAPGTDVERKAAYSALQKQLSAGRYVLPLTFADEVVVVRDTVEGPVVRQVADPSERFWDVLTWRLAVDR